MEKLFETNESTCVVAIIAMGDDSGPRATYPLLLIIEKQQLVEVVTILENKYQTAAGKLISDMLKEVVSWNTINGSRKSVATRSMDYGAQTIAKMPLPNGDVLSASLKETEWLGRALLDLDLRVKQQSVNARTITDTTHRRQPPIAKSGKPLTAVDHPSTQTSSPRRTIPKFISKYRKGNR